MAGSRRSGAVFGAFAYLQAMSLYNNVRQRVLRLRQPKYLFGALVGAAYLYFFLLRRTVRPGRMPSQLHLTPALLADFATLAALVGAAVLESRQPDSKIRKITNL